MRGVVTASEGSTPPRSRTTRWVLTLATVLAFLIVSLLGAGWIYVERAREAREEALATIRARGEPVLPEDLLATCPSGDPETREWWLVLANMPDPWMEVDLDGETAPVERVEQDLLQAGGTVEELPLLRSWLDCVKSEPEVARFFQCWEIWDCFDPYPTPEEVTSCELVALEIWLGVSGNRLEHAMQAGERGPQDLRGELERMLAWQPGEELEVFPRGASGGEMETVRILSDAAALASLQGRSDDALELLDLAVHAAGLMEGRPSILGHDHYSWGVFAVGGALERVLAQLPEDANLESVEAFFVELDPRGRLQEALKGDRAFCNRIFQLIRDGRLGMETLGAEVREGPLEIPGLGLLVDLNQREYLELMELILEECAEPRFDWSRKLNGLVRARLDGGWGTVLASVLVTDVSRAHSLALCEEVLRDFALAAIRAHREGIEAARTEVIGRTDPFSGGPYRARVEADGTLVMWSVDSDGENGDAMWDEMLKEYTKLTWRYRPVR